MRGRGLRYHLRRFIAKDLSLRRRRGTWLIGYSLDRCQACQTTKNVGSVPSISRSMLRTRARKAVNSFESCANPRPSYRNSESNAGPHHECRCRRGGPGRSGLKRRLQELRAEIPRGQAEAKQNGRKAYEQRSPAVGRGRRTVEGLRAEIARDLGRIGRLQRDARSRRVARLVRGISRGPTAIDGQTGRPGDRRWSTRPARSPSPSRRGWTCSIPTSTWTPTGTS